MTKMLELADMNFFKADVINKFQKINDKMAIRGEQMENLRKEMETIL